MTIALGDFPLFYGECHPGDVPFAWQVRVLDHLWRTGRWPERIVAPTGSGKTAVIDIHLFAVALMAAGAGPRVPRRLSLVVDRRALVDSQHELALRLVTRIAKARSGVVGAVREALAAQSASRLPQRSLVSLPLLRGGVPTSRRWIDDPAAVAIICATPEMWGSRLLFRGYGTSTMARPREAGLLAYDSVVVVDEAHLSRQFVATARRIADLESTASHAIGVPVLQVVESSATADSASDGVTLGVEAQDLRPGSAGSGVLHARLQTPKPVSIIPMAGWPPAAPSMRSFAGLVADHADELRGIHGPTVAAIVNTVASALAVASELRARGRVVELIVGRMRPHDLAGLRRRRPGLLTADGDPQVDVVVATQTIEVGVDADFSAMVTELSPASALVQRAGRVNRVGRRGQAEIRVVSPAGALSPKGAPPYSVEDLAAAKQWLQRRSATPAGLAPGYLADDPPPSASLRRVVLARPEPWDAGLLARSSDSLFAEPDLDLWLADDLASDADVSVVVRAGVGQDDTADHALLAVTPPRDSEAFPSPIGAVRNLIARDSKAGHPLPLRYRAGTVSRLRGPEDLRPGDVVVVGEDARWFTHGVVAPDGKECADDVLEEASPWILRIGPGQPSERTLGPATTHSLLRQLSALASSSSPDSRACRDAMAAVLDDAAKVASLDARGGQLLRTAGRLLRRRLADTAVALSPMTGSGDAGWVVVADQRRLLVDEEVRQTWSGSQVPVGLARHQADVAERAVELSRRVGLAGWVEPALRSAGLFHDEGKRDPRFQTVLGGPERGVPLAKSGMRTPREYRAAVSAAALPSQWRHEQLSALIADADLPKDTPHRDLVLRLIGTSHGRGRTSFAHSSMTLYAPGENIPGAARSLLDEGGWDSLIEAMHRLYGTWACAYLEAILRAADGQVSGEANGAS